MCVYVYLFRLLPCVCYWCVVSSDCATVSKESLACRNYAPTALVNDSTPSFCIVILITS